LAPARDPGRFIQFIPGTIENRDVLG